MKKIGLSFFLFCLFFMTFSISVNAKEVARTCKYEGNDGYNVLYIDIYDDNSTQAYVKKYLKSTEGDGLFTTYEGYGNKEKVQNWNKQDSTYLDNETCPIYALITNGIFGFNVYASDDSSELENEKGNKNGYILNNDESFNENYAVCEYNVQYTSDSYLRFKINIKDENYIRMYYMKNGEETYYDTNFSKSLLSPTVFGNGISSISEIGSNITISDVYSAYQNNGNRCPYIITTYSGSNVVLSVSNDPYHDGVNSFSSTLIDSDYSEEAPEAVKIKNTCVSHYQNDAIPAVVGAEFTFNTYSDNKREFCVKLENWSQSSCVSFNEGESPDALNVTTSDNKALSFLISEDTLDDFYQDQCIGGNFYVYESAGISAGIYVLTTDEEEAKNGTSYTEGQEGSINASQDQQGFQPGDICEGDECDVNLNNFCGEPTVARTFKFLGLGLFILKILVPAIIIIMGFVNLFKIITSGKEDEAKKYAKIIVRNVIIGVIIFIAPGLINFVFDLADDVVTPSNKSDFSNCVNCILDPMSDSCVVQD